MFCRCPCKAMMRPVWDDGDVTIWQCPVCGQVKRTEEGRTAQWADPPDLVERYRHLTRAHADCDDLIFDMKAALDDVLATAHEIQRATSDGSVHMLAEQIEDIADEYR